MMPDKHSHGREPESSFSPQAFPIIRPRAQAASITGPAVHHVAKNEHTKPRIIRFR